MSLNGESVAISLILSNNQPWNPKIPRCFHLAWIKHTSINQPLKFYIYKQTNTPSMMFLDEKKIPFQYHKHSVFTIISQTNQPNLKFTSLPSFWGGTVFPLFCCRFTQLQGRSWTSAHNAFVLPTNSHPRWVLSLRFDASKQVVPGNPVGFPAVMVEVIDWGFLSFDISKHFGP